MNFMKRQIILVGVFTLFLVTTIFTQAIQAKSVYAIINHSYDIIGAYKIQGNQIEKQTEIQVPTHGFRAIDLGIDSVSYCIFVTYEGDQYNPSNIIEIINAKSLENEGSVLAIGASNLAGIVFDEAKQKLYVVDRQTDHLFVYLWNAASKTLTPDGTNPKPLSELGWPYAYGLALDRVNGHLYVTNYTNIIHYYDTNDWSHVDYVDVGEIAVDIDIDSERRYLYAGGYTAPHNSLLKLNLSTGIAEANDIGAGVIGLAVDQDTGLVYTTTAHFPNSLDHQLRVYDTTTSPFTMTDYNNITRGCGVCVPTGDISYKPPNFNLSKDDGGVVCVSPDQQFTYSIHYNANDADTSVVVKDTLPPEVDYISSSPQGQPDEHTVTWTFPYIEPGQPGTLQIQVALNCHADPGGTITNVVEMEGDNYYSKATLNTTQVCCYGGPIIYVDKDATNGCNNGTSWDNAYTDLQDALTGARNCGAAVTAIWVAAGTYKPTQNPGDNDANFAMIEGVGLFGHFGGVGTYETCINQRNFANLANKTTLDGQIGVNPSDAVQHVVTAKNIGYSEDTVVDGFTITGSYNGAGVLIDDCPNSKLKIIKCNIEDNDQYGICSIAPDGSTWHFELQDCVVMSNSRYGIYCERSWPLINKTIFDGGNQSQFGISASIMSDIEIYDSEVKNHTGPGIYASQSDVTIRRCVIQNNGDTGVACILGCSVEITQSKICANKYAGIYLEDSLGTTITNNWICDNLRVNPYSDYAGIYLNGPIYQALIRNNTVCNNEPYGIYLKSGTEPSISNCILYYNNNNGIQISGVSSVNYSCVQGGYNGTGNRSDDPNFMNPSDPNDLHIDVNSPCKNAGDPNGNYDDETDIDGEERVKYERVDIGGDEYYWSPADFNNPDSRDGLVNFIDYAIFANAWMSDSDPNDPNWNPNCDIATPDNNQIDYADLAVFCEDWLWQAGWTKTFTCGAGKGMSQTMAPGFAPIEASSQSIFAEQQIDKVEPLKIEQLIDWLEELWLDEETQKLIDKDTWLKFIESVKEGL